MDGTEQVRYWNVGTGSTGTVDLGAGVYYEAAAPGGFIVASAGVLYRQAVTGARTSLGSPPGGVGTIVGGDDGLVNGFGDPRPAVGAVAVGRQADGVDA